MSGSPKNPFFVITAKLNCVQFNYSDGHFNTFNGHSMAYQSVPCHSTGYGPWSYHHHHFQSMSIVPTPNGLTCGLRPHYTVSPTIWKLAKNNHCIRLISRYLRLHIRCHRRELPTQGPFNICHWIIDQIHFQINRPLNWPTLFRFP